MASTRERPILFSAAMVRALLSGAKTQTRRVLREQNPIDLGAAMYGAHLSRRPVFDKVANAVIGHRMAPVLCPYGHPGDRLWVRETWAHHIHAQSAAHDQDGPFVYAADGQQALSMRLASKWTPGIHMFRWASRITLEIDDVRVERLQAISRGDAMAEGCPFPNMAQGPSPRDWYAELWNEINGPGAWAANPFVWCVNFHRIDA
jgi:hypothetical protein